MCLCLRNMHSPSTSAMSEHLTMLMIIIAILTTTVAERKERTLRVVTSSGGQQLCANDAPTTVEWLKGRSAVACGVNSVAQNYVAYNFNTLNGKCGKYAAPPSNYSSVPGCTSYTVKGDIAKWP